MKSMLFKLILVISVGCASGSLTPYLDDYKEIKSQYEEGLVNCQDYFKRMKALLTPIGTGEVNDQKGEVVSDSDSDRYRLIDDKQKVYQFIKYNRYPVQVVQLGHNLNSYIFNSDVQDSQEFEAIYEDYTNSETFGNGETCEESQTILNFYTALIPNLKKDFERLTERNAFLFTVKNYINSKKFMSNEPLISVLVDVQILKLLTENKYTKIKPSKIKGVLRYIEKTQSKLQKRFDKDLKVNQSESLENLTASDDPLQVANLKSLNNTHKAEIKLARKVRKKINKLMKQF